MGNGASVSRERWKQLSSYDKTEKLLLKGHFSRNVRDLKVEVEECIQSCEMDRLEILMSAHNAKDIHPIHIAAKLGSLEACELLLSAGFDCMSKDIRGQTPLHYCPLNQLNESILCATLLGNSVTRHKQCLITFFDPDILHSICKPRIAWTKGCEYSGQMGQHSTAYRCRGEEHPFCSFAARNQRNINKLG
jgi:Ankyrin repeats (many copies)